MSEFSRSTPWGWADHVKDLGEGIMSVSTPSHGGIFVPDHLLDQIPYDHRRWAFRWSRSENWYEEDCCWAAVAVAFPHLFTEPEGVQRVAAKIIEYYCPKETAKV